MKNILNCLVLIFFFASCASLPGSFKALTIDPGVKRQVITVTLSEDDVFKARLTAWEHDKGRWRRIMGPWPAVIGRHGFAPLNEKKEGDGRTPSGVFGIGLAFGRDQVLDTGLAYRRTGDNDFWVDDVDSGQYNQWVTGIPQAGSYETMLRPDGLYDLGAVIEYNTDPVVAGKGSAIFLHIWREPGNKPTAGCVALDKGHLRLLLSWLNAQKKPVIILGL